MTPPRNPPDGDATRDLTGASPAQAAAWAFARVSLSHDEAEWFAAEMARGAAAIERAAAGRALADVRMGSFDQMLRAGAE